MKRNRNERELLQNYNQILGEIGVKRRGLLEDMSSVDSWDIIAALVLAGIVTIGALGSGWIAYQIVIAISSGATLSSGMGFGISIVNWIKLKENREVAMKQITNLLNNELAEEIVSASKDTVKIAHTKIKEKLIKIFKQDVNEFENYLKSQ
jgi:hypothetical protein